MSNRQALHRELVTSFVNPLVATEVSRAVQSFGPCRACRSGFLEGGDNFVVGTGELLFFASGAKKLHKSLRFRCTRAQRFLAAY